MEVVDRLSEGVVEEGVLDVKLVHRPTAREPMLAYGQLHNGAGVHPVLGEPPASLVPVLVCTDRSTAEPKVNRSERSWSTKGRQQLREKLGGG
jgi:hypothetical protein